MPSYGAEDSLPRFYPRDAPSLSVHCGFIINLFLFAQCCLCARACRNTPLQAVNGHCLAAAIMFDWIVIRGREKSATASLSEARPTRGLAKSETARLRQQSAPCDRRTDEKTWRLGRYNRKLAKIISEKSSAGTAADIPFSNSSTTGIGCFIEILGCFPKATSTTLARPNRILPCQRLF